MKKKTPSTPTVTRDYLLSNGFREAKESRPGAFICEHAHLRNVMQTIGVPLAALRPIVGQPAHSDERGANSNGLGVLVRSEVRNQKGNIVSHSLDDPEAICTVEVWIKGPKREFQKTDGPPRLQIKSVEVAEDRSQPLQIEFALAATGKKPVAILQSNFHVQLTGGNIPPYPAFGFYFPEGTPQIVVVSPDKPALFKLNVPMDSVGWLSSGNYAVRIRIGSGKGRGPARFDYEWEGVEHSSEEYKFVVK
jgi:hypothetical protein